MKSQILFLALALTIGSQANAKGAPKGHAKSKTEVIDGQEAQKRLTDSLISVKDSFEGDDCVIESSRRGHDLEMSFSQKDKKVFAIEIFEDTKYKFEDQSEGDDGVFTISSMDGKVSVTIEQADDAFDKIIGEVNGKTVDCEMDM